MKFQTFPRFIRIYKAVCELLIKGGCLANILPTSNHLHFFPQLTVKMSQHEMNPELPIKISATTFTATPSASRSDLLYSTIEATIQDLQTQSALDRPELLIITDITTQEGEQLWNRLEEIFESNGIRKSLNTRRRTLSIKL